MSSGRTHHVSLWPLQDQPCVCWGGLGLERRLGTLLYDFMTLHNLSSLLDSFAAV